MVRSSQVKETFYLFNPSSPAMDHCHTWCTDFWSGFLSLLMRNCQCNISLKCQYIWQMSNLSETYFWAKRYANCNLQVSFTSVNINIHMLAR